MSPPINTQVPWAVWQKAWYDWASASGLEVVWAKDGRNPPQPRLPFVRLDVISSLQIGEEGIKYEASGEDDVTATAYSTRRLRLNVQVIANARGEFANNAWAWADELQSALRQEPAREIFRNAGLSLTAVGDLTDISAIEQSQFVSRVTFDVTFDGAAVKPGAFTAPAIRRVIGGTDLEGSSAPETTFDVSAP